MKIENTTIDDDDDDFDEEAEARERYPFLFDDEDCGSFTEDGETVAAASEFPDPEANDDPPINAPAYEPNYSRMYRLSEEHLPDLDFWLPDSFFVGRPAHRYFIDPEDKPESVTRLFGDLWVRGEVAILFADTGVGKSILATQIAQSIASGISIDPFGLDMPAQRVAFFDLELSRAQFDRRYSNNDPERPAQFPFHRNFLRSPPNPDCTRPAEFISEAAFIYSSMVEFAEFAEAGVVIIDNISWVDKAFHLGVSEPRFMRALANWRRENGASVLILAHTPKRRYQAPITVNDLRGARYLANFADSIFTLGLSRMGPDIRYLKKIKTRSLVSKDDDSRVATLRIEKKDCFLGMEFTGYSDERDHIGWMSSPKEPERMALIEKVIEMSKLGCSQRVIGEKLGVSAATINRCLKAAAL